MARYEFESRSLHMKNITNDKFDNLLTPNEHLVVTKLGECFHLFSEIVSNGETRDADMTEICSQIHVLQHKAMSQAAGRAFPGKYRLLGKVLEEKNE